MPSSTMLARIGGILSLGVFAVNVYLGQYDQNLKLYNPVHWELNWLIAGVTFVAAVILLVKPTNIPLVTLAGIIWPIVYVGSLGFDVYTKLCFGASSTSCWPSRTDAFQYLILNNPNVPGGFGWALPYPVIPIAIALLFITFVLSISTVLSIRRSYQPMKQKTMTTPSQSPATTTS